MGLRGEAIVMTNDLAHLVEAEAGAIADHVRHGLQSEKAPHYRGLSDSLLRLRCRRLVDAFVEATRGNPDPFVSYVRGIAAERIAEGIGLDEIQRALTLLEGRAWQAVVGSASVAHLVEDLGVVTSTIGRAKDELAQAYVSDRRRSAAAHELNVPALFAGTDSRPDRGTDH
jgi:hypothetical protein